MRNKCIVPDCNGVIESPGAASTASTPCPECTRRVQVVKNLQDQVRSLQAQLLQLQSKAIGRLLPVLKQVAKKPGTLTDLVATVKRSEPSILQTLRKLEERGLVAIESFRRVKNGTTGTAVWRVSALGERIAAESNGVGGGAK